LHVKLRDSMGNHLRVELFCAPFSTLARRGYFVGIREWGDDMPMTTSTTSTGGPRSRGRRSLPTATREPQPALLGLPCGIPCESSVASGDSEEQLSGASSCASESNLAGSTMRGEQSGRRSGRLDTDGLADLVADDRSSSGSISMTSSSLTGSVGSGSARYRRRVRQRSRALAIGALKPTSEMGADLALVRVMRMVSMPQEGALETSTQSESATACCPLHRRIAWFKQRLRFMAAFECAPRFQPWSSLQCQRCGVVAREDHLGLRAPRVVRCFACEEEVDTQVVPPQRTALRAATHASL